LEREGVYAQIPDSAWFRVVGFALWHPYLAKPAPETPYLSGYWEGPGNEQQPFRAVWRLLLTLPTEEVHAKSLEQVLSHLGQTNLPHDLPYDFEMEGVPGKNPGPREFLEHVFKRWAIADEKDEESVFFYLRKLISRLAAEECIDKQFYLEHEDPAVRRGFYEVCAPDGRDEFIRWLERDRRNFIWGFVSNRKAYQPYSDVKTAFGELFDNKKALNRYLKPDEIETAEYMHLAQQYAWFEKTEAESVHAVSRWIDLDEGKGYGQEKVVSYTDIEGLANKVDKLASEAKTSSNSTGSLAEALSTVSLMAQHTNKNLLSVAKDLAMRAANVERRLDRYQTNVEAALTGLAMALYWTAGAAVLFWVAGKVWQALTD